MAEDNYRNSVARQKRVQRLKKIIILFLLVSIMIPIICCVILFVQVAHLNKRIAALETQVQIFVQAAEEQQGILQEWFLNGDQTTVHGKAEQGQTQRIPEDESGVLAENPEVATTEEAEWNGLHKVYLTFDDGPSVYTDEILNILDRYQVKATFFVVGKEDADSKERLCKIAEGGHSIGLHSYSHKYGEIYKSVEAFAEDFEKLQDYVYETTGVESKIYRFPGGSSNTVSDVDMQEFADYLHSQDVEFFDWNAASGDGSSRRISVNTLVENAISGIKERQTTVILLHDGAEKKTTVEALPIIIENILAMEDTVILPITESTKPVQHIETEGNK